MFFTPNFVAGLTIMAAGVVLLMHTLGVGDAASLLKYWPGVVVLFGASIVAQSLRPADPATARRPTGVPCFFLFLLSIAMFASFGGGLDRAFGNTGASVAGIMGRGESRNVGPDIRQGRVASVMGRSTLDLREVKAAPGDEVIVDVFVAMGGATVRIPDDWIVDAAALPVMGSVEQHRFRPVQGRSFDDATQTPQAEAGGDPAPQSSALPPGSAPAAGPPPRLVLRGFVLMGKVEVTS